MAFSPRSLKVVFFGTPEFSVPSLKAIYEEGYDIVAVVTRPEKPKGRGRISSPTPVKEFALERGFAVLEPVTIRDEGFIHAVTSLKPGLIVVVAYGKILPSGILSMPEFGCVNLHASILPCYRGAAPIARAILNGDKKTGVSTMLMDEGMDTGPVFLTEEVDICRDDTAGCLSERLSLTGAGLLVKTLRLIAERKIVPVPQLDKDATYAPMLKKEDGKINWSLEAGKIENLVRGLNPWPGAYTYLNGKLLKIHAGRAAAETPAEKEIMPGKVISASKEGITVECGSGTYVITGLQPENRRRMSVEEFLSGYRIEGMRF